MWIALRQVDAQVDGRPVEAEVQAPGLVWGYEPVAWRHSRTGWPAGHRHRAFRRPDAVVVETGPVDVLVVMGVPVKVRL